MRTLAIDWGEKRWGLAFADELGVAIPLLAAAAATEKLRWAQLEQAVRERRVERLVVGYPWNMNGTAGFKAREVDTFIAKLEKRLSLPVFRADERLSTHMVEVQMRSMGRGPRRRDRSSGDLDSRAATVILQDFLDSEMLPEL